MARKKKKPARDMTTDEAIKALFPRKIVERIRRSLLDDFDEDGRPKKKPKKPKKSKN
jgi:hypothetical protein